jgi:hypothetical protein
MTNIEKAEIIKGWVVSCETYQQLDLCIEIVDKFFTEDFEYRMELLRLIEDRRLHVGINKKEA